MRTPLLLVLLATLTSANGQDYDNLIIFGDSFTNAGNSSYPSPPFFKSRSANGPIWTDYLADHLQVAGSAKAASTNGGANYAYGGATTGSISSPFGAPGVNQQINEYLGSNSPQANDLFVIWAGANDVFAEATPQMIATQTGLNVSRLADQGASRFLVGNMPAPTNEFQALLLHPYEEHNALLREELARLRQDKRIDIVEFDLGSLSQRIIANPGDFGLANVMEPACRDCITLTGQPLPGIDIVTNPEDYYLWDLVHPTTRAHEIFGEYAYAALQNASFQPSRPAALRGTTLMADSFDGPKLHPAWVQVDQNFQLGGGGQLDLTNPQPWGPAVFEPGGQLTMRTTGTVPPIDPPIEEIDPLFYDWQTPLGQGAIWAPSTVDPSYANGIFRTKLNVDGESAAGLFFRSGGPQGNYIFQAVGARGSFEIAANTTSQPGPADDQTVLLQSIPDLPLVAGKEYWVQSQILGDQLSLTVWEDGSPQPTSPQLTITDSRISGGWIGLGAYTHRGFTTGDVAVKAVFDDVSFTVPHELVLDDFNDGDLDGWHFTTQLEDSGRGTMIHDATSGALKISTENPIVHGTWDNAILTETNGDTLYANGIFRTVIKLAQGTTSAVNIRSTLDDDSKTGTVGGYSISLEPGFGTIGIVNQIDEFQDGNHGLFPGILDFNEIGIQAGVAYHVEAVADGNNISATAWPVGSEKPDQPQVSTSNAAIRGGGIVLATLHGPDPPTVRDHSASFDNLTFEQLMPGDFDNNKQIDATDLDLLANELRLPTQRRIFDMNNDGAVTDFDHAFLVSKLGGFTPGDADLNGIVEFADFLKLSQNFGMEGGWSEGNFNTDALVGFEDFLALSQNFGGGATAAATVPEPNATWLVLLGCPAIGMLRRGRMSTGGSAIHRWGERFTAKQGLIRFRWRLDCGNRHLQNSLAHCDTSGAWASWNPQFGISEPCRLSRA